MLPLPNPLPQDGLCWLCVGCNILGYRNNITSYARAESQGEHQLREEFAKAGLHPQFNRPLDCYVTESDMEFYPGYKYEILQGWPALVVFVDGPHHATDKFLERDAKLTELIESPYQKEYRRKVVRVENWKGSLLTQKQICEAIEEVQQYVRPLRKGAK